MDILLSVFREPELGRRSALFGFLHCEKGCSCFAAGGDLCGGPCSRITSSRRSRPPLYPFLIFIRCGVFSEHFNFAEVRYNLHLFAYLNSVQNIIFNFVHTYVSLVHFRGHSISDRSTCQRTHPSFLYLPAFTARNIIFLCSVSCIDCINLQLCLQRHCVCADRNVISSCGNTTVQKKAHPHLLRFGVYFRKLPFDA